MVRFILICMLAFSVFNIPSDVDASWLSKAWGRLEDSLERADTHAPPSITDTRKDIKSLKGELLCPIQILDKKITKHSIRFPRTGLS